MLGNIDILKTKYGFINGDDGTQYFFHKSELTNCTIYQLKEGDRVEFQLRNGGDGKIQAVKVRKKSSFSESDSVETNPGINPQANIEHFNDDEKIIVKALKDVLYVSNGGEEIVIGNSRFKYCLIKPTQQFNCTFNLKREIVVVFSDYVTFEPRSLDAASYIANKMTSKLRIDRGCQILISNDSNIEERLVDVLRDTNLNSIVIPFSYKEFLDGKMNKTQIEERFKKYLFAIDLFSTHAPIVNDLFFFGRRDYVYDIANKCKSGSHCGVFGLRRSGKTSLLYAVQRLLNEDDYQVIYIPCQSKLAKLNWNMALYEIVKDIQQLLGIKQNLMHSKKSYQENAPISFEEDVNLCCQSLAKPITLLFDEIEAITFDVPGNEDAWRLGTSFADFWNTIRGYYLKYPAKITIVVAGTNPMINEVPVIAGKLSNPMFGQLSQANQGNYLQPFDLTDTKNMVNTLGNYMGLSFDERVCSLMVQDCGGHPYLIRLLCSSINKYIKDENIERPKKVTVPNYEIVAPKFESSSDATGFYLMVLNILITSYPQEYNVLKEIALNGDKNIAQFIDDKALAHLLGYGLVEVDNGHYSIKFNTIKRYLQGQYKFEREGLTIQEQKEEIQFRIDAAEVKLRSVIKNILQATQGATKAKSIILTAMSHSKAISQGDITRAQTLTYSQLFDPSVNKIYFSLLSIIIEENINLFTNVFNQEAVNDIKDKLTILNQARRVPDHSYTEKSENWTDEKFVQFRKTMSWLENILADYD